jgi:hypothetical protein
MVPLVCVYWHMLACYGFLVWVSKMNVMGHELLQLYYFNRLLKEYIKIGGWMGRLFLLGDFGGGGKEHFSGPKFAGPPFLGHLFWATISK